MLILYSKLMRNVAELSFFNTIMWWFMIVAYFFWATLYIVLPFGVVNVIIKKRKINY